jgi:hypothetical protein
VRDRANYPVLVRATHGINVLVETMKNKQVKFDERFKKELSGELYKMTERNEIFFRKMLEESGVDTSKMRIVDRAKFVVKYIPDVVEELFEKYGTSRVLTDNDKIRIEALDLIQKRFHEDLAKKKVKSWNIYYMLLYCDIPKLMNLDKDIALVPFNGWPCNDYLEILDNLFSNLGPPASRLSEENLKTAKEHFLEKYREKNPISLLIFQNVKANAENEVYEKTKDYAENVMLCMSNLTNCSIELRGWVIEGKLEGINVIRPTIFFPIYKPTYMKPESMEEAAKRLLKNIDKNHLLKLALKHEKEALSEDEEKFRTLKRWSALEFIAEEYVTKERSDKRLLSKTDMEGIARTIEEILTGKGVDITPMIKYNIKTTVGQINHKNAKEKIRDLLEWAKCPIRRFDKAEKDVVDIIYQHRNCIVHFGGCYKSDKTIKEACRGPAFCRESELELKDLNCELSQMLAKVIGRFIGVEFEFHPEIPDHI